MASKRVTKKAGATGKRGVKGLRLTGMSSAQAKRIKGGDQKTSPGGLGGTVKAGWNLKENKVV